MRVLRRVRNGLTCSMESEFGKGERAKSDWKEEKDPSRMSGKWFEEMREVKQEVKRGKSEEKWSNTWVENWPPGQSWLNGVCIDTKASTSAQTVTTVFSGRFPLRAHMLTFNHRNLTISHTTFDIADIVSIGKGNLTCLNKNIPGTALMGQGRVVKP